MLGEIEVVVEDDVVRAKRVDLELVLVVLSEGVALKDEARATDSKVVGDLVRLVRFFRSDLASSTANGAALVVLYSRDLEATQANIERAGGLIVKPVFAFPGGRRFHFTEPSGNELAVWSDINA